MTTADVRDMLGLPTKPKPPKKQKQELKGRKPGGLEREIQSLHGDRPPPLPIIPVTKYKERPKRSDRIRPWEIRAFGNQARGDGLILHHWKRKPDANTPAFPNTPAESNAASEEQDDRIEKSEQDSVFSKFNIKVDRVALTEDLYNAKLQSEEWTKEETEYLLDLAYEFDLRWILIADRYEYKPPEAYQPRSRSMEDLKARYYHVAATVMTSVNPLTSMSAVEFDSHEKMTKYDPELEKRRKGYAESLLLRPQEEVQQEEMLLAELKRIVRNQEKFDQDRKDLYARLDPVQSITTTAVDRSSQGLYQLMQTLISAERSKRKRFMGANDGTSSPANGAPGHGYIGSSDRGQRHSLGNATDKRSSLSGIQSQRQLTPREEHRYGVSHHERLTASVQFRHERITKLSQAKSNAQSTKIGAALTELGIPPRLNMPTVKVCAEFERLIQSIHTLLDVRKVSEKLDTEIKILQAQREPKKPPNEGDVEVKSPGQRDSNQPSAGEGEGKEEGRGEGEDEGEGGGEEEREKEKEEHGGSEEGEDDAGGQGEIEADGPISKSQEESEDIENAADKEEVEEAEDDVEDENDQSGGDDEEKASREASATRTARSASGRKRSASVMSSMSNKSSKKQRR
ncbi:MAG: hypothetical protein LQ342_005857 [Letrouitia transgressa]|nr:MAG: hypothetical protein LQ342_005857 [Letrouitia transgressa]